MQKSINNYMDETIKKIDQKEIYTLSEIAKNGFFPWVKSKDLRRCRTVLEADRKAKNLLAALLVGQGRQQRYHVQGRNLIKFLQAIDTGKYRL